MENKQTFCTRFFKQMYTSNDGYWAPCCYSKKTNMNIFDYNIEQWYNSDILQKLRDGDDSTFNEYCQHCVESEKSKGYSVRTKVTEGIDEKWFKSNEQKIQIHLKFFEDTCNLSCFMCKTRNSRLRKTDMYNIPNYLHHFDTNEENTHNNQYIDYVSSTKKLLHNLDSIKVSGGEPTIIKKVIDYLEEVKHLVGNIEFQIQTNMMEIQKLEPYFKYFKTVRIEASIDMIDNRNDYLRKRSDFNKIYNNVLHCLKIPNVIMDIIPCFTMFNINYIDEMKIFWENIGARFLTDNFLHDPFFLSYENLPKELNNSEYPSNFNKTNFCEAIEYMINLDKLYGDSLEESFPELYEYYINIINK